MGESFPFDIDAYTRKGKAKMVESDSCEIQEESPRSQSQPYHTPNSHVAAETEERINPRLLRAIVNGDLMGFKSILRKEEEAPNDGNSGRESNGGIQQQSRHFSREKKRIYDGTPSQKVPSEIEKTYLCWYSLAKSHFLPSRILSYFCCRESSGGNGGNGGNGGRESSGGNGGRESSSGGNIGLLGVTCGGNTALHVVVMKKSRPIDSRIPYRGDNLLVFMAIGITNLIIVLTKLFLLFFRMRKIRNCIAAARRTRWYMRLFPSPNVRVHKMTTYEEIARIIDQKHPALIYSKNKTEETPLHCAVKAGKLEMVSLLVKFARDGDPQKLKKVLRATNQVEETALHEAARSGYSDIVKELLSADEDLASLVDENGISPLYLAVAAGCLDVVQQLIAPNREPSYAGPDGQTALHAAVMIQEESIMRVILEWKPDIAAKADTEKNTPLHYAALIGNTYAVQELLSKDTESVYKANKSGSFPVHLAAEAGNSKVIKELLTTCPDVGELLDKEKRNFLHISVEKKKIRVIMLAYKEGINANVINAKDKDGNTPLHLAVINSESEIFALLCQNKRVNPNMKNEAGLTPLDLSASLKDHQFTYTLNPQSIIHRALKKRGAFQNPCQHDLSKKVNDFCKARVDCLNRREGREMKNGVVVDIEKESAKYESMSKSLITGAVLIASATFASIFTVSGVYRGDHTPHTLRRSYFFKAFIIVNMAAFICAIVSTIWLLYSALSNFHLKYRKFYFKRCTSLLHVAINFFILTFGLGAYIAIAPLSEWLALVILVVSGIAVLWNIIWSPKFIPLFFLVPYMSTEFK